jgi:hypothetical protein
VVQPHDRQTVRGRRGRAQVGGRATDIVDFYTLVDNVFTPPIGPETLRQYGGGADVSPLWLPFRLDGRQLEELVSLRQRD